MQSEVVSKLTIHWALLSTTGSVSGHLQRRKTLKNRHENPIDSVENAAAKRQ
jgi:hypothetical protein